jgi:predicted acyl esterase
MDTDGRRLAARIWMSAHAESTPVPAVLEHLPYRRRDFTPRRDETMHPWLAAHGYACVRVDMRGSGDSDGIMHDEYLVLAEHPRVPHKVTVGPWAHLYPHEAEPKPAVGFLPTFELSASVEAREGAELLCRREWQASIPAPMSRREVTLDERGRP